MQSQSNPSDPSSFPDSLDSLQRRNHEASRKLALELIKSRQQTSRALEENKAAAVAKFGLPEIDLSGVTKPLAAYHLLELVKARLGEDSYICITLATAAQDKAADENGAFLQAKNGLVEAIVNALFRGRYAITVAGWIRRNPTGWVDQLNNEEAFYLRLAWIDAMQLQLEQML
jgi:hypothetical protein